MVHQLFDSPLLTRSHTYSAEEADPLAWRTRRRFDSHRPFDVASGEERARAALKQTLSREWGSHPLRISQLITALEPGVLLAHATSESETHTKGVSAEEAAYWIALCDTPAFWQALETGAPEVALPSEPFEPRPEALIERLHALYFPASPGPYVHERRRLLTFMLGVILPYNALLAFLVEHALLEHISDLGPPPEEERPRAVELFTGPFLAHLQRLDGVGIGRRRDELRRCFEVLRVIPAREAVEALLAMAPWTDHVLAFACKDDRSLFDRFKAHADRLAADSEMLELELLKHFLLRFGFTHLDELKRWLKPPKVRPQRYSGFAYQNVLRRFTAPEAALLRSWADPPPDGRSLRGQTFHHEDTLEMCAGVLALLHEGGLLKKLGAVVLKERFERLGEAERQRVSCLRSLCSQPVQKLLHQEFGMAPGEQRELPEPMWTPWMRRAASLLPGDSAAASVFEDEALGAFFDDQTRWLHAGEQIQFLFPKRALLGLFQAQRTGRWQEVTQGAFEGHPPLVDGLLYAMDMDALLSGMYARWREQTAGPSRGECWFLPMLGACGESTVARVLRWEGEPHKRRGQVPSASLLEAVNALSEAHAPGVIAEFAWLEAVDPAAWRALSGPKRRIEQRFGDEPVDWERFSRDRTLLSEDGSVLLDYGARKIAMRPDAQGNASYRTPEGQLLTEPPRVAATDRRERANESLKRAHELLKSFPNVLWSHRYSIEDAMLRQQLFSVPAWTHYLVSHPVRRLLIAGLVWRVYSPERELVTTALLLPDGSLMTRQRETFSLSPEHRLTPVHRLDPSEEEVSAWRQVLAGLQLIQPLPQLEREVFLPSPTLDERLHHVLRGQNMLKPGSLSHASSPGFRRSFLGEELIFTLERAVEGSTLTLSFGKGWEQKRMCWLEADGKRYTARSDRTTQLCEVLSPLGYSELCHFLRPKWEGPAF